MWVAGIMTKDGAPATTPWRLRDYEPSPMIQFEGSQADSLQEEGSRRRMSIGHPTLASLLSPSPVQATPAAASDDDDDDL